MLGKRSSIIRRYSRAVHVFLAVLAIVILAVGCGAPSGDSPSFDDVVIGEGTFIEAQYAAPLPEDESITVNVDDLEDGMFRVEIDGAADDTITGEGTFAETPGQGWFVGLSKRDPSDGHVIGGVALTFPIGTPTGTYRLFSQRLAYNMLQEVVGIGGMFFDDRADSDSAIPFRTFENIIEGKVTLISIEPLTGAFEFKAESTTGQTVTVSGAFKNLPRSQTQPQE